MKNNRSLQALLVILLTISLSACNLPQAKPSEAPTQVATTVAPTPSPLPPTETPTPEPPTATPTEELPSPTVPTLEFPTKVPSKTPTAVIVVPPPRARFDGIFEFGKLVFRIDNNPAYVVAKTVTIKNAPCKEGKGKISNTYNLDPPKYFEIVLGKFYVDYDGFVKLSGEFLTPNKARGTLTLYLKLDGKNCTIGPYAWTATTP